MFSRKTAGLPSLAMSVGSQAKHMRRAGKHAVRRLKLPKAQVAARNAQMAAHAPKMPKATPRPAPTLSQAVKHKKTPQQGFSGRALRANASNANPAAAVQRGRGGSTITGTASLLDQLSRTSFDKLSRDAVLEQMFGKLVAKTSSWRPGASLREAAEAVSRSKKVPKAAKSIKDRLRAQANDARMARWGAPAR